MAETPTTSLHALMHKPHRIHGSFLVLNLFIFFIPRRSANSRSLLFSEASIKRSPRTSSLTFLTLSVSVLTTSPSSTIYWHDETILEFPSSPISTAHSLHPPYGFIAS